MDFTTWTTDERQKMFIDRVNTTFVIERSILSFENIENEVSGVQINVPFLLPPILMDERLYGMSILLSTQDNKGRWIRTMLRTYLEGGHVVYTKIDNDNFKVEIKFPLLP